MDVNPETYMRSDKPARPALQQFDWTSRESVCAAVVDAVSAIANEPPTVLPPLYESVDTDALEAIVANPGPKAQGTVGITFSYDDYLVEVTSNGVGHVWRHDDESVA